MAVSSEFRIDVRPYTGYDDPSLPVAAYIGQAGLAGDASGGDLFITFLFQRSADEQISELFNLEQLAIDTTGSSSEEGIMQTIAMDSLAPNRPASPQIWRFEVQASIAGVPVGLPIEANIFPLWLGSPSREEGNGGLRFQFDNIDTVLYAVTIQGYMWGPRSVLAQGGPRRPIGGLFGNG